MKPIFFQGERQLGWFEKTIIAPTPDNVIKKGMKLIIVDNTDQRNQLEIAFSHT
jgi:K+/H+ antiporter YhaU regulatory subunit KhtT